MEPSELLALALEACGGDKFLLAQRLGMELESAPTMFGRWRRGENAPHYVHTMRLLEIAGLLRQPGELDDLRRLIQTLREQDAFRDESVEAQVVLQERLRLLEDRLQADDAP